jgi:prophage tail gpP-like protein
VTTEKVSVVIGSEEFAYWSNLELTLSLDTFATLTFKAPFEPENAEFRRTFEPFTFKPLKVFLNGSRLFTGTLVGVHPTVSAERREVEITGYALPSTLADCNAPGDTVPHEFKKVSLKDIAAALAGPFGIPVEFRDGAGKPFAKVKLDEDKAILEFLAELGRQRKLVFSSTPDGVLLCWQSVAVGKPVASFSDSESPITKVEATFSPQDYFSQITGRGRSRRRYRNVKHTEKNPYLSVLRPMNFMVPDTDPADVPEATRAQLGRMFANMASWTLPGIPGWRDPQGVLFQPNTTIMLTAPGAMVYRETELLVREVTLRQSGGENGEESCSLGVVLPGAFSGEVPSFMPWQEPAF